MYKYTVQAIRQKVICNVLRNKELKLDELLKLVNEKLYNEHDLKTISETTLNRDLKELRNMGIEINSRKTGTNFFYILIEEKNLKYLTEAERMTLPFLMGLLDTEKKMKSVEWLKTALIQEFDFTREDLNPCPYFVHVQPTLDNKDKLLLLASKIIDFIKKGQAIKFLYDKKGEEKFKQVAPLQIRYYDNRYYLLGTDIDENTNEVGILLKTYTLDKFIEKQVYAAIIEVDEVNSIEKHIYFDYQKLYNKSNLENLLNNSLGIWYDWENKLKTFKLKFSDWAMGIVENKKIHPTQRVIEKTKEYTILEISVWDNREIDFYVGRFGDKCVRLN